MMDANARTGKREVGDMDDARVLGEYGRDTRNDNGRRPLKCAAQNKMVITNTFFRTPIRGESSTAYTYAGPKVEHRWRLDYILVRQYDRRLVRNVTVHTEVESDHRLVSAAIRLLGRTAPNRQPQPRGGDRGVRFDRRALASDRSWRATVAQAIAVKLPNATDSPAVTDVNHMAFTFANALRQTAADTLPRCAKKTQSRGFSESSQAQDRLQEVWDLRESVWKKQRANPEHTVLKKALKVTEKAFKRVKDAELQNFVHEFTVRTADFVRKKDQAGLYQHIQSLELEGKKQSASTYVRSATGELLRDKQAILQRWKEWFDILLNATSPTIDHSVIDLIEQLPEYTPLAVEPSMAEVKQAVGKLANGKAVGTEDIYGELLKLGRTKDSAILKCLHDIVLIVWRQE
ncbi:unnamed protein product, partial [Sphacelaria rigidula]